MGNERIPVAIRNATAIHGPQVATMDQRQDTMGPLDTKEQLHADQLQIA